MDDYLKLQNTIIKKTLWFALGTCLIFVAADRMPIAKGIALGALFGVLDLKLLAVQMRQRVSNYRKSRDHFCTLGRFALLSVPLFIAIKMPIINFAATVVGIMSVKAVIIFAYRHV